MGGEERVREMLRDAGVEVDGDDLARVAGLCRMLDGFAERLGAVDVGEAPPAHVFSVRWD
ncbi:MAG TPA: hypothetical protein VGL93_27610 [Streptosporangiaceae bacterium]|jgi:hypothetical protein